MSLLKSRRQNKTGGSNYSKYQLFKEKTILTNYPEYSDILEKLSF